MTYILESLDANTNKWFKEVHDTMQQMIKDKKIEQLEVDVEHLNKRQKPFEFDDFANNQYVKKIIADKQVGFTVTNQMLQMPKKYLMFTTGDEEQQLKPKCFPYWYRPQMTNEAKAEEEKTKVDKNEIAPTYFVGIIMYDTSVSSVDGFVHLVDIEASLCVKESLPLLKAMLSDWALHSLKEANYTGVSAKPTHPKMKAQLLKLGFTMLKDNKDILTYKL